jgi:hypothetical protein
MQKNDWLSALVPSNMPHIMSDGLTSLCIHPSWQQSQTSERLSPYLVGTYKAGSLGSIPSTNVLIKGFGIIKHIILRREKNEKQRLVENTCSFKSHTRVMD